MKPDWKDAPPWANWLAMDSDGEWYWFEHEPIMSLDGIWNKTCGNFAFAGETKPAVKEPRPCPPQSQSAPLAPTA